MSDTKPSADESIAAYVERMIRCYRKAGGNHPSEELVAAWRVMPKRFRDQEPAGAISQLVADLATANNELATLRAENTDLATDRAILWDAHRKRVGHNGVVHILKDGWEALPPTPEQETKDEIMARRLARIRDMTEEQFLMMLMIGGENTP